MEIFNCVVALVFCGGLVWFGWQIVNTALLLDERSSTGLEFPMWIYYASLPIGGGADVDPLRDAAGALPVLLRSASA